MSAVSVCMTCFLRCLRNYSWKLFLEAAAEGLGVYGKPCASLSKARESVVSSELDHDDRRNGSDTNDCVIGRCNRVEGLLRGPPGREHDGRSFGIRGKPQ